MRTWTKRDPVKNYFPLPNEIYQLGLSHGEIAVYGYLLRIEDRRTCQCHPSYATIGKAVGMSNNTVRKYVQELEERGLIVTERTSIITRDGHKQNGSLLYTILPIQFSIDQFYQRQMDAVDRARNGSGWQDAWSRPACEGGRYVLCVLLSWTTKTVSPFGAVRETAMGSRSPAGPRRLGTATRMSVSLFRRLSAFFESTPDQDPKAAKFAVLPPGHAGFPKRAERFEGNDSAPIRNAPCFAV